MQQLCVENNNNQSEIKAVKRTATDEHDADSLEAKRLKPSKDDTIGAQESSTLQNSIQAHPSPKKRLQIGNKSANDKGKHNKGEYFKFGNYKHYYGKRLQDTDFHDIRLDVLAGHAELFRGKQILDIGCNSGLLSIAIARQFEPKSLIGLDIDRSLTNDAQTAITTLKRASNVEPADPTKFPFNVKFVHGNYVLDDDVLLEIERPQFDVVLCLSVTKWIHLNFSDAGLKQAFRRMYLQLRIGGKLILEPQAFDTYKRRKKLSENIRENYAAINFKPEDFTNYLLSPEVGFASMELMGVPEHCKAGFKRPIQIFSKN